MSAEQRKPLLEASGRDPRDEGCGIADMLRLSLGLHRATGKPEYLERAERCLLNHLYFNQFTTGDFGSRSFFRQGTKPTENVDRAWWCCTMHGYRAFPDVLASIVRPANGAARVDLFVDADWAGDGLAARRCGSGRARRWRAGLTVEVRAAKGAALALRRPSWAEAVRTSVNGATATVVEADGALRAPAAAAGGRPGRGRVRPPGRRGDARRPSARDRAARRGRRGSAVRRPAALRRRRRHGAALLRRAVAGRERRAAAGQARGAGAGRSGLALRPARAARWRRATSTRASSARTP